MKIGQGCGPSALIPGSQKSPGSEKTPTRRQPEISVRNGINLLELRPSKNTVIPVKEARKWLRKTLVGQNNSARPSKHSRAPFLPLKEGLLGASFLFFDRQSTQMGAQGGFRKSGYFFVIPILKLKLEVKIVADGTKNDILPD